MVDTLLEIAFITLSLNE